MRSSVLVVAFAALAAGQFLAPVLNGFSVSNTGLQPGVTLNVLAASSVAAAPRYRIVARPDSVYTNFTTLSPTEWQMSTVATGWATFPSLTGNAPVRPGYLRIMVPGGAQVYDCWDFRGDCPYVLRNEPAVGSWSMSVYVDMEAAGGSRSNGLAGLAVYDNAGCCGFNGYRLNYHLFPSAPWISCDFAGGGQTCGTIPIPSGLRQAWLRIDYDAVLGIYTLMYRFTATDRWAIQAAIQEDIIPYGGKVWDPRVGLFVKTWVPNNMQAADFSNFRFSPAGPWARPKAMYFPASQLYFPGGGVPLPNVALFMPLPRYTLYRVAIQAIGPDGVSMTPETAAAVSSVIVIGAPAPGPRPNASAFAGLNLMMDATSQALQKNAQSLYGAYGTHDLFQWRDWSRPQLALGQQYDKSAVLCYAQHFTEADNNIPPNLDTDPFGVSIFVVARADAHASAGVLIGKGNANQNIPDYSLIANTVPGPIGWRGAAGAVPTTDMGATTLNSGIETSQINVYSFHFVPSSPPTGPAQGGPFRMVARLNGGGNWTPGGFGVTAGDDIVQGPLSTTGNWFRVCTEESGTNFFQGSVFEVLFFPIAVNTTETAKLEAALAQKYYLSCPALTPPFTLSQLAAPAPGVAGAGCGSGAGVGAQCIQTCANGTVPVSGSPQTVCTRGMWTGHSLTCGSTCPRLNRPNTATGCSRILQWEPFVIGPSMNDTGAVREYPRTANASATLARWGVYPAIPDSVTSDIFNVVSPVSALTVLTTAPVLSVSYDSVAYDPVAVWQRKDVAAAQNFSLIGGTGPANASSGLLYANSLGLPNESPQDAGYVLFTPGAAWPADFLNSPSQAAYWYSARVRPITDIAGVVFKFNTAPSGPAYASPPQTSYYVAAIDAEATDLQRDIDPVVKLWRVQGGVSTLLDSRTWTQVRTQGGGLEVARGRWYTLSARTSPMGITVWLTDDSSGNGTQVMASPDVSLGLGSGGVFISGAAFFDDLIANTSCAVDGSASGLASNYHTGLGGVVQHFCPPAYLSTGSQMRACMPGGSWSGTALVCSPPPPRWVMSLAAGDGLATIQRGVPTFNRTLAEDSPSSTLVGMPLSALATGATALPLQVLFQIPTVAALGGVDNGNTDGSTGLDMFSIDACGGQIRVRNNVFDYYVRPSYNITVWAYVVGEAGAIGFTAGSVTISLTAVNKPPVILDAVLSVSEGALGGTRIGLGAAPNNGPLLAPDREGNIPVFSIVGGNTLGLFTIGPNPPLVPAGTPGGQLAVAAGVDAGAFPGTQWCDCGDTVLNFEGAFTSYVLTVRATDGLNPTLFTQASITIIVNNTNDAPWQPPGQLRTIMENAAVAGAAVGNPMSALDEDVGDTQTWSITGVAGGPAGDGVSVNMAPINPPAFWPLTIDPASGQISLLQSLGAGFNPASPVTIVQGYATRAAYTLGVAVTDRAGARTIRNQTLLILANVTAGVAGTITGMSAPAAGLNTAGGDVITVTGDFLPIGRALYANYSRAGGPVYIAPCTLNGAPPAPTYNMNMSCIAAPGVGALLSVSFFAGAPGAPSSIAVSGTVRAQLSYTRPSVSFLTQPVGNATSTGPARIAGSLLIDLQALDYQTGTSMWDNRATPGPQSTANGDFGIMVFGGTMQNLPPGVSTYDGQPGVTFDWRVDNLGKSLSTDASPALFDGMFGGNPWSTEVWIRHFDAESPGSQESPYFEWGVRPGNSCNSAFLSVGHHPVWGAGGHWNCDTAYSQTGQATVQVQDGGNTGWKPTANVWHHIVVTYGGALTTQTQTETLYVDGQVSTVIPNRILNIGRAATLNIGSWLDSNQNSFYMFAACAIARFRVHSGVLSAGDVMFNYMRDAATFQPATVLSSVPDPNNLLTAGGQQLLLNGANFGGFVSGVSVTYTGPSPLPAAGLITYTANVVSVNHTSMLLITSEGLGAGLVFTVSVGGQSGTSPSVIASYAPPLITAISNPGPYTGAGGQNFVLTATGLGPMTFPGVIGTYTPTVQYGQVGAPSYWITAQGCNRIYASRGTTISCATDVGAGAGLVLRVCVGSTGQCSAPSLPPITVSYALPVLTGLSGALRMSTAGGERIVAAGVNFGTVAQWSAGLYSVALQWGFPPANWIYTGVSCGLEPVPGLTVTAGMVQISCITPAGYGGSGLIARVVVGGRVSAPFTPPSFGFAQPVILGFSGPGAVEGATMGGQAVFISGINFGYDSGNITARYRLALQAGVRGYTLPTANGSFTPNAVTYVPSACVVSVPHTQLTCTTVPGAGAALEWSVVVNGVANVNPSTSYAAPIINGFALFDSTGTGIASAATSGGQTLAILGSGFGPATNTTATTGAFPLLQSVVLYGPSGTAYPMTNYSIVSDGVISITTPPGSGAGWRASVTVADRDSALSSATFAYSAPSIASIDCGGTWPALPASGSTRGGTVCTLTGANFALEDPRSSLAILFGNPIDGSAGLMALRTSPVYRSDNDTTTTTLFVPNTVVFTVPSGFGTARAVRAVAYRTGDPLPNPAAFAMQPVPITATCGTPCFPVADAFTYSDPLLALIVVSRPITAAQTNAAIAAFDAGAVASGSVRMVTLYGDNFGSGAFGTGNVMLRDIEIADASGSVWSSASLSFVFDSGSWADTTITAYTLAQAATIRVALRSTDWSGVVHSQYSAPFSYANFNPAVSIAPDNNGPFPTTGTYPDGTPVLVSFSVSHLASTDSLSVTVGGASCPLVDVTGGLLDPATYTASIVNNALYYTPVGQPIGPTTTWALRCRLPPGQGANVPLIVTRSDGAPSAANSTAEAAPAAYTLSYAPPRVDGVSVFNGGIAAGGTRFIVATDGSSIVTLTGSNFGTCPRVSFATITLGYCAGGCPCADLPAAARSVVMRNSSVLTFPAPPGEGDGVFQTGSSLGWTMLVNAGGQTQSSGIIRVGYLPPSVFAATALGGLYPTRGGVRLTITGANFGASVGAFVQASLPPYFQVRVYVGAGAFTDPLTPSDAALITQNCTTGFNYTTVCTNVTSAPGGSSSSGSSGSGGPGYVAPLWRLCPNPLRVNFTAITCDLPEGSGAGLAVIVAISGQPGVSASPLLTYDPPVVTNLTSVYDLAGWLAGGSGNALPLVITGNATSQAAPLASMTASARGAVTSLRGPTRGGFYVVVNGANFGPNMTGTRGGWSCIFVAWRYRDPTAPFACDGWESFAGEGEVYAPRVLSWTHERVIFVMSPGAGDANVLVFAGGQTQINGRSGSGLADPSGGTGDPRFTYSSPIVTGPIVPSGGPTTGGTRIVITGDNFGLGASASGNVTFPIPLPLPTSWAPALQYLRINWGPQVAPGSFLPSGACISSSYALDGITRPVSVARCTGDTVTLQTHTRLELSSLAGVGRGLNVSVSILDGISAAYTSNADAQWSYDPPLITGFYPPVLLVGATTAPSVYARGVNFGSPSDLAAYPAGTLDGLVDLNRVDLSLNGDPSMCIEQPQRVFRLGDAFPEIECKLNAPNVTVGYQRTAIFIAGQASVLPSNASAALFIGCQTDFYGYPGENCLPCPVGAACAGFQQQGVPVPYPYPNKPAPNASNVDVRIGGVHYYPVPMPQYFNLNSSAMPGLTPDMSAACPPGAGVPGRDVCIVRCDPPEACLGANLCAAGYTSTTPYYRCASCANGFYKQNGNCIKCPDSPAALVIGFALLVIAGGALGYILNKRAINIAYLSIGVDYCQVLAMFASAKVSWPPAILSLFHILSAFNLNLEIVAPECLVPNVGFIQKFSAVMLLPVFIGGFFAALHFGLVAYKAVVLRRDLNKLNRHAAPLVASELLMMYILYIYLCKTTFDVFNCQQVPGSGLGSPFYLQVVFEQCGVPGGTQMTLMPWAIASLAVYVAGYPGTLAFLFWRNKELIIEDQLLRAKGVGNDRLTNPNAYELRRMFSRVYYQYKPDYYFWTLAVILRKFFIAFVSLMFAKNASFQLAACLLVMFIAYAFQVRYSPYMSPAESESVLRAHAEASFSDPMHARLRLRLALIETRGRKKTRQNILNPQGRVSIKAVLGVLTTWLFNYNTVEQLLIASAIIVCLMGIMYDSAQLTLELANQSRDAITAVVMAVIITTILYFIMVVCTEVYIMWTEADRRAALLRGRKAGGKSGKSLKDGSASPGGSNASRRSVMSGGEEPSIGATDVGLNPMFLSSALGGGRGGADTDDSGMVNGKPTASLVDALTASNEPPPPELWRMFRGSFLTMIQTVDSMSDQLAASKMALQKEEAGTGDLGSAKAHRGGGGGGAGGGISGVTVSKRSFGPMAAVMPGTPGSGDIGGSAAFSPKINPLLSLGASSKSLRRANN